MTRASMRLAGGALVLALLAGATSLHAEDDYREKCEAWLASCDRECVTAAVPEECRDNCRWVQRKCLSDCGEASWLVPTPSEDDRLVARAGAPRTD
jgi:hypothetical protein